MFALIRDDGAILARYPDISTQLDTLSPDGTVMRSIAEQPEEGVLSGTSSLNGHSMLFAYRKMPHYNIYVVSGIPSEVIIQDWLKNMASHLIFGLPATVAMIGLGTDRVAADPPGGIRLFQAAPGSGRAASAPNSHSSKRRRWKQSAA